MRDDGFHQGFRANLPIAVSVAAYGNVPAALVTIWTAAKTKQTLLAMLAGMLVIMMLRHWF